MIVSAARRRSLLVVVVSIQLLLLAACQERGSNRAGEETRRRSPGRVIGGTAVRGGVMRWISDRDIDFMDPGATYEVNTSFMTRGTSRTLTTYAATPDLLRQNEVVPDLATRLGEHNASNTRWTYHLKKGIQFGPALGGTSVPGVTGRAITSADFEYAIKRLFVPSVGAQYPFYFEDIEGVTEFTSGKAREISGIETPDDNTIMFRLTHPIGDWDYRMSLPATSPVPERFASRFDSHDHSDYGDHVVYSGPYYVAEYVPGSRIVLRRNEYWDHATDSVREAFVDKVFWKIGSPADICLQKILDNDYDLAVTACFPQESQIRTILDTPEYRSRFFSFPDQCESYVFLNTTVKPFDNPVVRRAVNLAVDRRGLLSIDSGIHGALVASSVLPPGVQGYLPTSRYDPFRSADRSDNLEKARALMRQAGYARGYHGNILLVGESSGNGPRLLQSLANDLEAIGIDNLEIRDVPYPHDFSDYYQKPSTNTALGFAFWCSDYPSGATFLEPLLYGPAIPPRGTNYAQLDDPKLNVAIEDAERLAGDRATRAWTRANRIATEDAAWVPFSWGRSTALVSDRLQGAYFHTYYHSIDWVNAGVKQ